MTRRGRWYTRTMRRLFPAPTPAEPGATPLAREEVLAELGFEDVPNDAMTVRAVFVSSLDGAIAGGDGRSGTLSTPLDRAVFLHQRDSADAIIVGAGTARGEGYGPVRAKPALLAQRRARGQRDAPVLCLVTGSLAVDPAAPLIAESHERVLVATTDDADWERVEQLAQVTDVARCGHGQVDLRRVVSVLADRGLHRVVCEGGPTLLGAMLAADLVDELSLTHAPLMVGGGPAGRLAAGPAPAAPLEMALVAAYLDDDQTMLTRWRRDR